jgi:hypothetical protein
LASIINASNSGFGGIVSTGDSSGQLQLQTTGTTALTIDTSQNVTLAGTLAMSSSFLRNRIINGDMRINQRNAGASVTPTTDNTYTLDRWRAGISQSSKFSIQQNAGSVTPPAGFNNYLGVTSLSSYSVGSGDYFLLEEKIEGFNVADLGWGAAGASTVTLSFWVRSSLTGTFGGVFRNSAENRSYPFSYTISSANTWEQKTVTVSGDTSGTWLKTNGTGLAVAFSLGMGSSVSGTAGAWVSANLGSVTGATSVVGTNGATWYLTGVQLEIGTSATPFERRLYNQELANCQRYYLRLNSGDQTAYTSFGMGVAYTTTAASITVNYPVQMRANPTYNSGNSLRLVGSGVTAVTSSSLGQTSYLSSYITVNVASGLTTNNAYWFGPNGDSTAFIDFTAEL